MDSPAPGSVAALRIEPQSTHPAPHSAPQSHSPTGSEPPRNTTVNDMPDTKEQTAGPLRKFGSLLYSVLSISMTDGVLPGIEENAAIVDSIVDEVVQERLQAPTVVAPVKERSIWDPEAMGASRPTVAALEGYIGNRSAPNFDLDILYERGAVGETILHYALLRKQFSTGFLAGRKQQPNRRAIHSLRPGPVPIRPSNANPTKAKSLCGGEGKRLKT
ncbi:hypothetical protein HK101_002040 [Irineochytrium annulatum]|nr:hypothetical protein HK101_002040 [Irineochytrium annulatum]